MRRCGWRQTHFNSQHSKGDTLVKSILVTGLLCLAVSTLHGTGQAQSQVDEAASLNKQAGQYMDQERYDEAEALYKRALAVSEKSLGPDHPDTATSLHNLAYLYHRQEKYAEAEPLYKRALAVSEKALDPDHQLATIITLNNLAELYKTQKKYAEAEPLYKRAIAMYEKGLSYKHPVLLMVLTSYAAMLREMGRGDEAARLSTRAAEVRAKANPKMSN
jgi:tetratricopeptide (TPR) repeat protein